MYYSKIFVFPTSGTGHLEDEEHPFVIFQVSQSPEGESHTDYTLAKLSFLFTWTSEHLVPKEAFMLQRF